MNVQSGALANVLIMICITVWALYLIFRNKRRSPRACCIWPTVPFRSLASLFALLPVWHWLASAYFIVLCFFSLFDPGNSLKFMMGATFKSGHYWRRGLCFRPALSLAIENHYLVCSGPAQLSGAAKRVNGWLSVSLKVARILTVCVAIMLLLNAGTVRFLELAAQRRGEKTVDILIRIALILFFSAVGWTLLASLIENRRSLTFTAGRCQARVPAPCSPCSATRWRLSSVPSRL